jgi:hypothetical protein
LRCKTWQHAGLRTPPATAYEIARQASRDLATLLANWKTLRDTRFKELNLPPR